MSCQFAAFGPSWRLPVEVPYSAMLRDGDRAWSSNQMALDAAGVVQAPGDLAAQARIIIEHATEALAATGLARKHVSRLVLYCADHDGARRAAAKTVFTDAFGSWPLIEMVSVPHFAYPGMLLAVDVFCAPAAPLSRETLPDGGELRYVREAGMELLNLSAPADSIGRVLGAAMTRHGLSPDRLMSGWGVCPEPALNSVPAQVAPRLPGFFSGALMPCFLGDDLVHLYLSFATIPVELIERRDGRVRLHLARGKDLAVLDARYLGRKPAGLVQQTEVVMDSLKELLIEENMSFGDVVKSTTFFAGGDAPEVLHANQTVRNGYYAAPGPASTAVPIARMADPGSMVRVELILRPPQPAA